MIIADLLQFTWLDIAARAGHTSNSFLHLVKEHEGEFAPTVKKYVGSKKREIDRPSKMHKRSLRKLNKVMQRSLPIHEAAYCGVPGLSCHKAVQRHLGRSFYVIRDLHDCYPSVTKTKMRSRLLELGMEEETSGLLAELFTVRGRVSQGSPLSCLALNLFLYQFDCEASRLAAQFGGRYTRWGDDMIFSFSEMQPAIQFSDQIDQLLEKHSLRVNERKKIDRGFLTSAKEVELLGLVVNSTRGTKIPKERQIESASLGVRYIRAAQSVDPDSLETVAKLRRQLMGKIHDARQAHFSNAEYLFRLLKIGDRRVNDKLRSLGLQVRKARWWLKHKTRNEPRRIATRWRSLKAKRVA